MDEYEKNNEIKKEKDVRKLASEEHPILKDFEKCANDLNNKSVANEETSFRSKNHRAVAVMNNKIAMPNDEGN